MSLASLRYAETVSAKSTRGPTVRALVEKFSSREDQITIVLSLILGVLVGLVVVAFILLTGRLAARMYPSGSSPWRRVLIPTGGALATGYLLFRYFPQARG